MNTPSLARFAVENYRCLESVVLEPDDHLTFLVGRNGSGKSSILDAVQFLADWVQLNADALLPAQRCCGFGDRLSFRDLLRDPTKPARWIADLRRAEETLRYEVALEASTAAWPLVIEERVTRLARGEQPAITLAERDRVGSRARRSAEGEDWIPLSPPPACSLLDSARDPAAFPVLSSVRESLGRWHFLKLDPVLMRDHTSALRGGEAPDRYGRDLGARIAALLIRRRKAVDPWLGSLDRIAGWKDVAAELMEVRYKEVNAGREIPLALASDGQLVAAYLGLLAAYPPESTDLLLLDEPALSVAWPDVGFLEGILEVLSSSVQVLTATHARPLVDVGGRRDSVWLVERAWGEGSSVARLLDHPRAATIPGVVPPGTAAEELWAEFPDGDEE